MRIAEVAVKRPVTIWMFTFAVLLFGMVSLSRLSVSLLPDLSYPTLTIRTDYVGSAPAEVEQLVSKPIEEAIGVVKGVRSVNSISKAGQSDVTLEFEWGTDMDMSSLEVREKLDVIQLPLDVKKPLLLRFNPSLDPIIRLGLQVKAGEGPISAREQEQKLKSLRTYAEEEVKRKLESVSGVASVRLGGGLEDEIHVLIDQDKTAQLDIDSNDIINRLRDENVNQSGGRIENATNEYLVRTLNQFRSLDDIKNIYIATRDNRHIKLSDIATVTDSFKEPTSITRVNNQQAVELALYKEGDANTVQVAKLVRNRLENLKEDLPDIYEVTLVHDQSTFIGSAIDEVKSAAIFGGMLAMVVLYLFLKNIWPTIIISISIPVSVIASFNLMYGYDISLNIMSLGGIALAVGLLVDNSIVVLENIARHKENGSSAKESAINGSKEVSTAIVASTLTTMAVFFPLVFVEGIAGQLFGDQALTVTFALLCSLVVALTLIPMLAAYQSNSNEQTPPPLFPKVDKPTGKIKLALFYITWPVRMFFKAVFVVIPTFVMFVVTVLFRGLSFLSLWAFKPLVWLFNTLYNWIAKSYTVLINGALRHNYLVLSLVLLLSAGSIPLMNKLGVELIPRMAQGEFFVELILPAGTALAETDANVSEISRALNSNELVSRTYSMAGTGSLMNASPSQGGDYWSKLNVVMAAGTLPEDEKAVMDLLREKVAQIPGAQARFSRPELFSFKTPLEIELSGYDLSLLKRYSDQLVTKLDGHSRFEDIKTTMQNGQPEVKIFFNHNRLSQLGLTAPQVARRVAAKVGGEVASQYSLRDRKIDILVRSQEQDRNSVEDIRKIIVNPGSNKPVTLDAVANIEESVGPSEITRADQERVAIISADIAHGDLGEAVEEIRTILKQTTFPYSIQARVTGQSEEMEQSFTSLQFALALAVFMVYLVMASQFESLLHPLLILGTVPLAGAGSIYGLYLTGTNLSVIVFIGLIMLAGIVVNNAIILVDRINQSRESGTEKLAAIIGAAESRLRPIIMTTLTTALGLLPLALGLGEGAEIRAPMAITVIFGLVYATLLTLLLIPVLYNIFDVKKFTPEADHG